MSTRTDIEDFLGDLDTVPQGARTGPVPKNVRQIARALLTKAKEEARENHILRDLEIEGHGSYVELRIVMSQAARALPEDDDPGFDVVPPARRT